MPFSLLTSLRGLLQVATAAFLLNSPAQIPLVEAGGYQASIVSYEKPSFWDYSPKYELKVNGHNVPVIYFPSGRWQYDWAQFTMSSGSATIELTALGSDPVTEWEISPRKLGIKGQKNGNRLVFTIDEPKYLIVKINDGPEVVLLIDAPESSIPNPKSKSVRDVTSRRYGADPTGKRYSHEAIQKAINETSKAGGGTVLVPPGEYLCGNLILMSNVHFYLAGGAYLRYTGDPSIYTLSWYDEMKNKNFTFWVRTDYFSSNIHVDGRGVFDGNGYETLNNADTYGVTPFAPINTKNFIYSGPVVKEAGFWTVNTINVQDAMFEDMKVIGRHDILNNDGWDCNSCINVTVRHSIAVAWDDPYSTKTWDAGRVSGGVFKNIPGPTGPLENVLAEDLVAWTGCFGVKVGEGSVYPQTGVTYRDVTVYDAAIGMGMHHRWGTALLSDITFENIEVEHLTAPLDYGSQTWFAAFILDVGEGAGPISNVMTRNIKIYDLGSTGGRVNGWNESIRISNTRFENIYPVKLHRYAKTLKEANITDIKYVDHGPVITANIIGQPYRA